MEPRNLRNLTWNPYLEPRNLPEPLLGTLTRNLGTCRNLYLEPLLGTSEPAGTFTWNPYLEPRNLPEPLLGTLTWNLGTCRNLYLEPLLGTSEPARTWRDDCPRVPQGLVWLGPQSFQLLGKYPKIQTPPKKTQTPKKDKTFKYIYIYIQNPPKKTLKNTKSQTKPNRSPLSGRQLRRRRAQQGAGALCSRVADLVGWGAVVGGCGFLLFLLFFVVFW